MSMGIPAVVSPVGVNSVIVDNGENDLLVMSLKNGSPHLKTA